MEGARSILLSITGGRDISLWEVNEAAKAVAEAAHPDANIIFGAMVDEKIEGEAHFEIDPTRRELEWSSDASTGYRGRLVVTPEDEGARVEVLLSAEGSDDGMVDGISSALEGAKALIEAGHRSATEDERRWPEG